MCGILLEIAEFDAMSWSATEAGSSLAEFQFKSPLKSVDAV
jgi:hypothetical protein